MLFTCEFPKQKRSREAVWHQVYIGVRIDSSAFLSWQLLKPMVGNLNILMPINLEDVAALFVNCEATHHVAPVKAPAAYDLQAAECEGTL